MAGGSGRGPSRWSCRLVQTKLDFADYLRSLPVRHRRIAKFLAKGETTSTTSRKFGVSAGRISQMRAELKQAWDRHVGNDLAPAVAV